MGLLVGVNFIGIFRGYLVLECDFYSNGKNFLRVYFVKLFGGGVLFFYLFFFVFIDY